MQFTESKSPFASKTFWSGVVAILASFGNGAILIGGQATDFPNNSSEACTAIENIIGSGNMLAVAYGCTILAAAGGFGALYGRFKATKKVTLGNNSVSV